MRDSTFSTQRGLEWGSIAFASGSKWFEEPGLEPMRCRPTAPARRSRTDRTSPATCIGPLWSAQTTKHGHDNGSSPITVCNSSGTWNILRPCQPHSTNLSMLLRSMSHRKDFWRKSTPPVLRCSGASLAWFTFSFCCSHSSFFCCTTSSACMAPDMSRRRRVALPRSRGRHVSSQ